MIKQLISTQRGKCKNQIYNGDSCKEPLEHFRRTFKDPYNTIENKDSLPVKAHSKKEVKEILRSRVP